MAYGLIEVKHEARLARGLFSSVAGDLPAQVNSGVKSNQSVSAGAIEWIIKPRDAIIERDGERGQWAVCGEG